VLGSLFYGVILGIFLIAFYCRRIKSNAVFIAALLTEAVVILLFFLDKYEIIGLGFLWLNVIGALLVLVFALVIQKMTVK
jgi:SSS family solute:Na+ symporter